jgi:PLP dependent protein
MSMAAEFNEALLADLTERVKFGLAVVHQEISRQGIEPANITIVAVTKGWGTEAPLAGLSNGLCWFGENYADELVAKASAVRQVLAGNYPAFENVPAPSWTFQGKLQSNKINRLKDLVALWQTIDSIDRAHALGSRVPGAAALIQVVLEDSGNRAGCGFGEVSDVLRGAREVGLDVRGLMGVAPDMALHGAEAARVAFARLHDLGRFHELDVLSMGMSDDYALALSQGATHLRLGSVLFGSRTD